MIEIKRLRKIAKASSIISLTLAVAVLFSGCDIHDLFRKKLTDEERAALYDKEKEEQRTEVSQIDTGLEVLNESGVKYTLGTMNYTESLNYTGEYITLSIIGSNENDIPLDTEILAIQVNNYSLGGMELHHLLEEGAKESEYRILIRNDDLRALGVAKIVKIEFMLDIDNYKEVAEGDVDTFERLVRNIRVDIPDAEHHMNGIESGTSEDNVTSGTTETTAQGEMDALSAADTYGTVYTLSDYGLIIENGGFVKGSDGDYMRLWVQNSGNSPLYVKLNKGSLDVDCKSMMVQCLQEPIVRARATSVIDILINEYGDEDEEETSEETYDDEDKTSEDEDTDEYDEKTLDKDDKTTVKKETTKELISPNKPVWHKELVDISSIKLSGTVYKCDDTTMDIGEEIGRFDDVEINMEDAAEDYNSTLEKDKTVAIEIT